MSRLTCRFDGTACFKERDEGDFVPCGECYTTCKKCAFAMCLNKLAAYEDAGLDSEEMRELAEHKRNNRIYLLPCEIGSKVYTFTVRTDDFSGYTYPVIIQASFRLDMIDDLNKKVFLTKEEAETALERLKSDPD